MTLSQCRPCRSAAAEFGPAVPGGDPAGQVVFSTLDEPLTELRRGLALRALPAALQTAGHARVLDLTAARLVAG